jgi:hypothetical protein
MVLAYYLLFLLLLSASTCDATSRNQHLFLPSPAVHDHRHDAKVRTHRDIELVYM